MKKLILGFIIVFTAFSCSLDKDPVSSVAADDFYKTPSDAQAGVYGIYDGVQSTFRENFAFWGEGRADAVQTKHSGDPSILKQNTLRRTMKSASWNNLYETISRANYAIKNIPTVFDDSDDELEHQLLGQARALRALSYFYAVRIWGDVPLVLEPFESIKQDVFVERAAKEKVLDQIEKDLKFAAQNCNENYGGDKDRILITQGTANALLTKVYMYRKNYERAVESANKVINNSLYSLVSMDNWSKIFTSGYSNESIFEVGYNEKQTNALRKLYALGSDSDYFPSETFRNSFEEGDLRKDLIYDTTADQPQKVWKFFGKGFNDESSAPSSNNIVLIRLADIILLKAEALNAMGQKEEALKSLNLIRKRAGLSELNTAQAATLYGDIAAAIAHERAIELSFEGQRWFDLVRTGKAIKVMNPINGLSDEANLVWPISEEALNKNPKIQQNAFYK